MKDFMRDLGEKYHNYFFPGKRPEENIILLLRRHWLILFFHFIPLFFYFIVLVLFRSIGPAIMDLADINVEGNMFLLIETLLWMFFWVIVFVLWVDYYLDVWIVTDQRIIDIEQMGLFRRRISELEHEKIQDVTSDVQGVIPTLFNYGYVYVQTAGERERFIFKQVTDPVKIRNVIMELQQWAILQEKKKEGEILRGKF